MSFGEDFGYLKDEEKDRLPPVVRRALLLGAVLFSIACFVYITVTAYYFAYSDKDSGIKVVKSPPEPIKIVEEDNEANAVKDIDKTIYDNIVGNKNLAKENLNNVRIIDQAITPVVRTANAKAMIKNNREENQVDNSANKTVIKQNVGQEKVANKTTKIDNSQFMVYDATATQNKVNDASLGSSKKEQNTQAGSTQNKTIKGLSRVQIAALSSKSTAVEYWSRLRKTYPSLFSNLNYFISEVNLGAKGTFYRLQVGNFRSQVEAEEFCRKFIATSGKSKADCIIVE